MKFIFFLTLLYSLNINAQSQTQFQKHLNQNSFKTYNTQTVAGGFLSSGFSLNGVAKGYCMVSDSGTISWYKFFNGNAKIVNSVLFAKSDTKYYLAAAEDRDAIRLSLTVNHSFVWSKKYTFNKIIADSNYDWGIKKVGQLNNGDLYVTGQIHIPIFSGWGISASPFVCLFDSTGNLLWSKVYKPGNHNLNPEIIIENNSGNLIIAGTHSKNDRIGLITINGIGTFLINRTTGNITGNGKLNSYINNNADLSVSSFNYLNKTIIASSLNLSDLNTRLNSAFIFYLNEDATFYKAKKIDAVDADFAVLLNASLSSETGIYLVGSFVISDTASLGITTTIHPFCLMIDNQAENILWAKRYGGLEKEGQINEIKAIYNNSILMAGYYGDNYGYFWKANGLSGNAGCESNNEDVVINNFTVSDSLLSIEVFRDFLGEGSSLTINDDIITSNPAPQIITVCAVTGVDEDKPILPNEIKLTAYPNPFNPATTISFSLVKSSNVNLSVYNLLGEKVSELVNANLNVGNHSVDFTGNDLSSGIYFCRLDVDNDFNKIVKLILIK